MNGTIVILSIVSSVVLYVLSCDLVDEYLEKKGQQICDVEIEDLVTIQEDYNKECDKGIESMKDKLVAFLNIGKTKMGLQKMYTMFKAEFNKCYSEVEEEQKSVIKNIQEDTAINIKEKVETLVEKESENDLMVFLKELGVKM